MVVNLQTAIRTAGFTRLWTRVAARATGAALAACSVLVGVSALLAPLAAEATVPAISSLDGVLLSASGGPASDGKFTIKVSLYKDAVTATALWSETGTVDVVSGRFTWSLGSVTPLSPAVLGGASHFGIAVGADPELARRPLNSALTVARTAVAESLSCSGCVSTTHLDANLQGQALTMAKISDFGKSGAYGDLIGAPNVTGLLKKADTKTVATSGLYKDLVDAPPAAIVGSSCGSGLVLAGFKADGSLDCVAGGAANLPKDGIDDVSNNLIFNTFVDKTAGKTDVQIPDGLGAGVTDTLNFPSIGIAQKIWVELSLQNSDISGVKIELYGPGMLNPYVLYQGGKTGQSLTAKFNDDTPLVSGDMTKDFVGKDITGNWSLTVKDLKVGGGAGGFDGKFNWSVNIQTLSSKKIQIKGDLIVDGSITVGGSNGLVPQVFWSGSFHTFDNGSGNWFGGNSTEPYGNVNPSTWTDGNANASNIGDDFNWIRSMFGHRRAISSNANVCSEVWDNYSSTNSRMCGAVFRVQNATANPIDWKLMFYYTSYSGWSEIASVSLNGANNWNSNNNAYSNSAATVTLTLPPGKVSTVIVMSASSPEYAANGRDNFLAFYSNSLKLPAGLSYVDDLESVQGKWKQ